MFRVELSERFTMCRHPVVPRVWRLRQWVECGLTWSIGAGADWPKAAQMEGPVQKDARLIGVAKSKHAGMIQPEPLEFCEFGARAAAFGESMSTRS